MWETPCKPCATQALYVILCCKTPPKTAFELVMEMNIRPIFSAVLVVRRWNRNFQNNVKTQPAAEQSNLYMKRGPRYMGLGALSFTAFDFLTKT